MDKNRVIITVVLCLVITVGWNYLAEYMGWLPQPVQQTAVEGTTNVDSNSLAKVQPAQNTPAPDLPAFKAESGRTVTVDTPLYTATFHSNGGVLQSFVLKNYKAENTPDSPNVDLIGKPASAFAPLGLLIDGDRTWEKAAWSLKGSDLTIENGKGGMLVFVGEVDGLRIEREFSFTADTYTITEKTNIINAGTNPRNVRLDYTLDADSMADAGNPYNQTRVAWFTDTEGLDTEEDIEDLGNGISSTLPMMWAGVESNYFIAAIAPKSADLALKAKYQSGVYRLALEKDNIGIAPGSMSTETATYYFGPKITKYLAAAPNALSAAENYGFFTVLAVPMLKMINFFEQYVGNYGIAIILLTILIKIAFWPLSRKSYKSMESMKKLQPMMQKIREKYADDREKQNAEVMALYKTYKVNPVGGCLPMVIQIPVFFGLYQALLNAIQLRHASFIDFLPFTNMPWLSDLSAPDPYYITPIVMGATMLLQQLLSPSTGDPTQRKMMLIMPVVFTFMFLNFPSGLVVYWLVNNVLSIFQQWLMLRKA